jgi:mono/diheme cytochrome c family protein
MRTMRSVAVLLALVAVVGFLTAQASAQSTQGQAAPAGKPAFSVPADVRAIFDKSCVKCHGGSSPAAGHDYSTDADLQKLVGMASSEKDTVMMISPGHPADSYLIMKVRGSSGIVGSRMPLGGKPLSDKEIGTLETWIQDMPAAAEKKAGTTPAPTAGSTSTSGTPTKAPAKPTGTPSTGTSKTSMSKDPPPDPGMMADEMFDGAYVYRLRCEDCHGTKGEGVTLFGPPLAGNAFIKVSTPEAIGDVINMGRKYRDKEYPEYMGMPRFQFITGGELRALIDYLKGPLQTEGK